MRKYAPLAEYARFMSILPRAKWLARNRAIIGDWREYSAGLAASVAI